VPVAQGEGWKQRVFVRGGVRVPAFSDSRLRQRGARKIAAETRRIAKLDLGIERLDASWDDGTRMPSEYATEHFLILTAGGQTVRVRISTWMLGDVVVDSQEFEKLRKTLARKLRLLKRLAATRGESRSTAVQTAATPPLAASGMATDRPSPPR